MNSQLLVAQHQLIKVSKHFELLPYAWPALGKPRQSLVSRTQLKSNVMHYKEPHSDNLGGVEKACILILQMRKLRPREVR